MRTPLAFLRFVAKAVLNAVGGGVAGDVVVEVLPEVARDVWDWWGKGHPEAELRAEMQQVAQLTPEEAQRLAGQAVTMEAGSAPGPVLKLTTALVARVPATVRASQRSIADPSGRTVQPSFRLREANDLLPFLPLRLPRFSEGQKLPGVDWQLVDPLGVGGFGEVWRAVNPFTQKDAALKFCLAASAARNLRNEVDLLLRVQNQGTHEGIVQLRNTHLSADPPFIEYEYIPGGDLTSIIQSWRSLAAGQRVEFALRVMHQLAGIVAFAHQVKPRAIIHRDLKPANVLVQAASSGAFVLKVADFGIGGVAVRHAVASLSQPSSRGAFLTTALRGSYTPIYASPEQRRHQDPDPRDDIFSLGVIWLHLLTGDLMLEAGSDWRDEVAHLHLREAMLDLLGRCLAQKAERRPADGAVLVKELGALLGEKQPVVVPKPQKTPQPPPLPPPPPGGRERDVAPPVVRETVAEGPSTMARGRSKPLPPLPAPPKRRQDAGNPAGIQDARMEGERSVARAPQTAGAPRARKWLIGALTVVLLTGLVGLGAVLVLPEKKPGPPTPIAQPTGDYDLTGGHRFVHFGKDRMRVVLLSDPGQKGCQARVYDLVTGLPLTPPLSAEGRWVLHAAFSPDGQRLVAGGEWSARVWDASTGRELTPPLKHEARNYDNGVCHACFSPDGERIVTAIEDKTARVWDASTGKAITPPLKHEGRVLHTSFSPDGKRVVTASAGGTARVWDASTGEAITLPLKHEGEVYHASFSPDGKRVVTTGGVAARVWDASTGRELTRREPSGHHSSFSPDGQRVVTASGYEARVWDASTGEAITPALKHEPAEAWNPLNARVNHASFSPDGKRVVTASADKTARVWDASTGKAITPPLKHEGEVYHASFSPDGKRVVTASQYGRARLWDASTGEELKTVTFRRD